MLKYLLIGFVLYVLYKLTVKVIIPVYRTSKQVKQKFRQMQEQMQAQQREEHISSTVNSQPTNMKAASKKTANGDYIDFEEVK
jgi:predicted Holliday junction resolvase-like endonuclease